MRQPDEPGTGQTSPVWVALIAALGLILAASIGRAQLPAPVPEPAPDAVRSAPVADVPVDAAIDTPVTVTLSGTVEPCLLQHGNPETYRATLRAVGWADVADADRAAAVDRLMRLWLPVTGMVDGSWDDHVAHLTDALAYWTGFTANRTLMQRGGQVLALAGIAETDEILRVECWIAGDTSMVTDYFFDLVGLAHDNAGVQITQIGVPANDDLPETDYLLIRLTPPAAYSAIIPGGDGMRTGITIPFPAN